MVGTRCRVVIVVLVTSNGLFVLANISTCTNGTSRSMCPADPILRRFAVRHSFQV